MSYIRKIFRNLAYDVLMMVGFSISCFILLNVADLVTKIMNEEEKNDTFDYVEYLGISGETTEQNIAHLVDILDKIENGNTYINAIVNIDRRMDDNTANLVMQDNEGLMLSFKEGEYVSGTNYTNAVIIGESLEKYVKYEDGKKYLIVGKCKLHVIAIIENSMSGGIDTSMYILWDSLSMDVKERILAESSISDVCIKSQLDISQTCTNLTVQMESYGVTMFSYEPQYTGDYQNYWYRTYSKVIFVVSVLFSLFTCFSISYLWAINRKRELAIRMAYGYSRIQICRLLFKDLCHLVLPAFVLSVIIQIVYNLAIKETMLLQENFMTRLLILFGGIMLIVILNVLNLMNKLKSNSLSILDKEI